ncbi:MAG: DUF423 domain-containing protein [Myxococcales bacterium]|jgi:uncharacterized membrane protein YgdD (TMEM256/DUF423 family)|nr:DUF423 domain-containing protein [Myxococcales bacterium]MBL9107878.1 DUF423 domain-containing protein [Myxococcales bacterium]
MERAAWLLSAAFGFLAVALGAFGAHGLKAKMLPLADGAQRLEWWGTGAHYQAIHALALGLVAVLASRTESAAPKVSVVAFSVGIVLFSGSLYTMTLTGVRALGAVTPFGGVAMLVGWGAMLVAALGVRTAP